MTSELIVCPHCQTPVRPMGDGQCPACRNDVRGAPTRSPRQSTQPDDVWQRFLESGKPTVAIPESIASLRELESQFFEHKMKAESEVGERQLGDSAAAERIRLDLIPKISVAISRLQEDDGVDSRLEEYLQGRLASWRCLAEALQENSVEKLGAHRTLWQQSELRLIEFVSSQQSRVAPAPGGRVREFERALAAFTPRTFVTPSIVATNIGIFIAMVASGVNPITPDARDVIAWGADFGPKTLDGESWRLVTCMFLHFGFIHLGFNMWVLWELGRLVERLVGNVGFLLLYFVTGVLASITSLAWNPVVVSAGASGAVFGVAGALVGIIALRRDTIPNDVLKHLRSSMFGFLMYNIVFGMSMSGIDMAAHLGGLATGIVCGLILSHPLTIGAVTRRPLRNVGLLLIGAVVSPLAFLSLPDAPPDVEREVDRFVEVEERVLSAFGELITESQEGRISDDAFADKIEQKILPDWVERRKMVEKLVDAPGANRQVLSQLAEYAKLREDSWRLQVRAVREKDASLAQAGQKKWDEADSLVKEMSSQ